jgi:hypothetical protein
MKIALKIKIFCWYLRRGVILTKDNLLKRNWHGNTQCVFCQQNETIKHLFFQYRFARSIWSCIQVASDLYPRLVWSTSLEIGFMGLIRDLERLLGWGRLPLYGLYGCVEMIKFLMTRVALSCRLSIDVLLLSVCGLRYRGWRTATCLRRSVHC